MNKLYLGCTVARHQQIGIDAVINARGGLQHLNDKTNDDWNLYRDARNIRDRLTNRVRFYQFNSKFCRRNHTRLAHLLSRYDD